MLTKRLKKIKLSACLLATVIINNCAGPEIEAYKEPVLGTEKYKLKGYKFANREKSVNAGFVVSCNPNAKNNTTFSGTIYIASDSQEYNLDNKIKLLLEVNGVRHLLNIITHSQNTGELGKEFFKSARRYVTVKSLSFDMDVKLLKNITTTSNVRIILARETSATSAEQVDILILHPNEFESNHYKTIEDFIQKCNPNVKI